MAEDDLMDQSEIEKLLAQSQGDSEPAPPAPAGDAATSEEALGQGEIESLLGGGGAAADAAPAADVAPAADPAPAEDTGGVVAAPAADSDDDDKLLGQDDIEKLLSQAGKSTPEPETKPEPVQQAAPPPAAGEGIVAQGDIDYLLNQAEEALESITTPDGDLPQNVTSFKFEEFSGAPASTEAATLDLIRDVELDLKIELGRTHMYLDDVLKLRKGSVVPLDKLAGDPVDIYVNGRLIARGEVLVLNDNFCVRVAELIAGTNVAG